MGPESSRARTEALFTRAFSFCKSLLVMVHDADRAAAPRTEPTFAPLSSTIGSFRRAVKSTEEFLERRPWPFSVGMAESIDFCLDRVGRTPVPVMLFFRLDCAEDPGDSELAPLTSSSWHAAFFTRLSATSVEWPIWMARSSILSSSIIELRHLDFPSAGDRPGRAPAGGRVALGELADPRLSLPPSSIEAVP